MTVHALADYQFPSSDALARYKGKQLLYINWEKHRMFSRPFVLALPPDTPFAEIVERYITDWTGPKGRLGRMKFKMKRPVFPGDTMVFNGRVVKTFADDAGCQWVELEVTVSVDGQVNTECQARVAIPADEHDNPWQRKANGWRP